MVGLARGYESWLVRQAGCWFWRLGLSLWFLRMTTAVCVAVRFVFLLYRDVFFGGIFFIIVYRDMDYLLGLAVTYSPTS